MPAVQFAVQAYTSRSLPLAAQQVINLYVEKAPKDAKSEVALFGAPGIKSFATAGVGPTRGMRALGDFVYVVSGNEFYSVNSSGTAVLLGSIVGTARVSMSDNGIQIIIVDGTSIGYIYTTAGGLVTISDPDFQAATTATFQDGYFILSKAGATTFFISNLNDGTAYLATDTAEAEGDSDDLVAAVSDHRELWLFGERTTELWYNSGSLDFPFARYGGTFIERGCAAEHSVVADFDNTIVWLGDDRVVYRAEGYVPIRISQHAIEKAIEDYTTISDAFAFQYTYDGHKFYVLTFPSEGATWVYDASTGLWHQRESHDSGVNSLGRWRVNAYARAFGKHLVGDFENGNIGELDPDTFDEYGNSLIGVAASPPWHFDRKRVRMPLFELDVESGVGLTSGQGSDPQWMLDWSDDGGFTFGPLQPWRSAGKIGERKTRLRWRRMGQFRERIIRARISDPVKRVIIAAHADMSVGLS